MYHFSGVLCKSRKPVFAHECTDSIPLPGDSDAVTIHLADLQIGRHACFDT